MANLLVLVLLPLFALTSESVNVSIDCGGSGNYTDDNSIVWTGDDGLIKNGEVKVVNSSENHVLRTLREFSTRKKSCYIIPANEGEKVLVRASFFYGNYDNKSAPPTFDLHFDGNYWTTVDTATDGDYTYYVYYEVICVVKGNISVCVAQTNPNQLPFVSALEVRTLDSNMYNRVGAEYALYCRRRGAYGINSTVRYSDDAYDRMWRPRDIGEGLTVVSNDASLIEVNMADNPPQAVLRNAVTPLNTSLGITLGIDFPAKEIQIYINMYFSEVSQLASTQNRSFQVYINNETISEIIVPPYGSVTEFTNMTTAASSDTVLSLFSTTDSTLPPLLNAIEVFDISEPLTSGTNSEDVEGLALLKREFDVLKGWGGDPCLPYNFTWDWVNCNTYATARVTALYLSGLDLSGALPDFSSMVALEIIDLHNNGLSGSIPDFLGTFPNLKQLNLSDNEFNGTVPASLLQNDNLKLESFEESSICWEFREKEKLM